MRFQHTQGVTFFEKPQFSLLDHKFFFFDTKKTTLFQRKNRKMSPSKGNTFYSTKKKCSLDTPDGLEGNKTWAKR